MNSSLYKSVLRGKSHKRARPGGNSKFSKEMKLQRDGSEGFAGGNFIGFGWCNKQNRAKYEFPTLNQIFNGIIAEAIEQVSIEFGEVVDLDDIQLLAEAQKNISETWLQFLNLIEDFDKDTQLSCRILHDPFHKVTLVLLRMYSAETFLYKTINSASEFGDQGKFDTLGPYALALFEILCQANVAKKDLVYESFKNMDLYRGTGLTEAEIQEYRNYLKEGKKRSIYGYISTSQNRNVAVGFTWNDEAKCKKKALYHIKWTIGQCHCFVMDENSSVYPHEKEILIMDGCPFYVESIVDDDTQEDPMVVITLKATLQ